MSNPTITKLKDMRDKLMKMLTGEDRAMKDCKVVQSQVEKKLQEIELILKRKEAVKH